VLNLPKKPPILADIECRDLLVPGRHRMVSPWTFKIATYAPKGRFIKE
jgi:hypothetical protein